VRRVAAWLRYRVCRAVALPHPEVWDEDRYPKTPAGWWRYLREQVASSEVAWYESPDVPWVGCCGCGSLWPSVCTHPTPPDYPLGETYCWRCVDRFGLSPDEYRVLTPAM
jgi:hypothetical protein